MPLIVLIGAAGYVVYNQQKDISLGGIGIFESLGLKNTVAVTDTTSQIVSSDTSSVVAGIEETQVEPEVIYEEQAFEEEVQTPVDVIKTTKPVKTEISKVETANAESGKYYIIVGSFKNENNADKLHGKLVNNGKTVTKLPVDANGYYKVAVGSFESIDDANSEVTNLAADFSGIWVKKY